MGARLEWAWYDGGDESAGDGGIRMVRPAWVASYRSYVKSFVGGSRSPYPECNADHSIELWLCFAPPSAGFFLGSICVWLCFDCVLVCFDWHVMSASPGHLNDLWVLEYTPRPPGPHSQHAGESYAPTLPGIREGA